MSTETVEAVLVEPPYTSFGDMVTHFKTEILGLQKRTLRVIWEMGLEVKGIMDVEAYGKASVADFVEELDIPNVTVKEAYKYATFARSYTEEAMIAAAAKGLGWGAIYRLLSPKVRDNIEQRTALEDMVANKEIALSQLDETVQQLAAAVTVDTEETEDDLLESTAGVDVTMGTTPNSAGESLPACTKGAKKVIKLLDNINESIILVADDLQDLSLICMCPDMYTPAIDAFDLLQAKITSTVEELQALGRACAKTAIR